MINNLLISAEEQVACGVNFWKNFMRQSEWKRNDFIIVLGDNPKVNLLVLDYLERIKVHYQTDRIFLFRFEMNKSDQIRADWGKIYTYPLTEREYNGFVALYRLYKFSDRIIFVDSKVVAEYDTLKLLDTGKVNIDEIVKIGILGLTGDSPKAQISLYECVQKLSVDRKIKRKEEILLFGENQNTKRLIDFYLKDYKVTAVLDNDIRKENRVICGVPIKYPRNELLDDKKKIVIAANHYCEMLEQLEQFGYREGVDVFVVSNAENASDEELIELDWRLEKLRKGAKAYARFVARYPDTWLFYNPRATGNTYLLGIYIFDYIKQNKIDNFIVWNKKENCQELCNLMGIPAELAGICIEPLSIFADVVGWEKMKFKIMDPYNTRTNLIQMRGYKNIDFRSIYQCVLFGVNGKVNIPKLKQKNTENVFREMGLRLGNTVLIAPHAYTTAAIKKTVWKELISEIKDAGFDVCINCNQEEHWEGEKCVFLRYAEVIDFLNKAGFFIGARSGLCDIVTQSECNMAVLYPTEQSNELFNYFSIESMGLRKDGILEICDVNQVGSIKMIVDFIRTKRMEKNENV